MKRQGSGTFRIDARATLAIAVLVVGCGKHPPAPALEKAIDDAIAEIPNVPVPDESGPKIGAIANVAPVFDRPDKRGTLLGYLHAGETVARAAMPLSTRSHGRRRAE